jgi:hypothetical protein
MARKLRVEYAGALYHTKYPGIGSWYGSYNGFYNSSYATFGYPEITASAYPQYYKGVSQ